MDASKLTEAQLNGFSITERVCSVLSLLGCIIIIGTFCASKSFHKPINRLVFYASFGNMMTNVATLMARTYLGNVLSAGCQFQAFLIQMFMPADAFWTLAMAVNVYLTFYYKFDAQKLRRMELPYLVCCYGIPFIVALTYIFVNNSKQGHMYGNATLWCWVSSKWDIWRIATFYGPVWVVIMVTCFIYIRAGREIYKKHRQLRDFQYSSHHEPEPLPPMDDLYSSSKTTEVFVTTEIVNSHPLPDLHQPQLPKPANGMAPRGHRPLISSAAAAAFAAASARTSGSGAAGAAGAAHSASSSGFSDSSDAAGPVGKFVSSKTAPIVGPPSSVAGQASSSAAYSVTISSNKRPDSLILNGNTGSNGGNGGNNDNEVNIGLSIQSNATVMVDSAARRPRRVSVARLSLPPPGSSVHTRNSHDLPSGIGGGGGSGYGSGGMTGIAASSSSAGTRNPASQRMRRRAAYEANSAAWSYTKCAILFFTAMLVTWIPSSANRVFSVVHVDKVSLPLEYMSAFVLPLQGFWNALIYMMTSWKAFQTLWADATSSRTPWRQWLAMRRQQHRQHSHQGHQTLQGHQDHQHQSPLFNQRRSVFASSAGATGGGAGGEIRLGNAAGAGNGRSKVFIHDDTAKSPAGSSSSAGSGSDEMLDRMVGGRGIPGHAGSGRRARSEKAYETESMKELAVSRTSSRDH